MHKLARIAIASVVATTGMTLFSSLVSRMRKKEFEEPDVLNLCLQRMGIPVAKEDTEGWWLHYLAGLGFTTANYGLMRATGMKPNLYNGILLGKLDGALGVATWLAILHHHPNPPKIDRREYLNQLFIAHIVFGLLQNSTLALLEDEEENA